MIETLVFDAYGTLFDVGSVQARCEEVFPGHGSHLTTLWRTKQLEYTWLRTLMVAYEDFWQITKDGLVFACRSLGLAPTHGQIEDLMQSYLRLSTFPDVDTALGALSSVPCSILSNGTPSMLESVVRNAGLEGRFQRVLSVDAIRTYKPSPSVYQLAETHLGLRREEIGFVSSNAWDAAGGKAFGLRAYWLNRQNAPAELLGFLPDGILHSAMELTSVVTDSADRSSGSVCPPASPSSRRERGFKTTGACRETQ
jgi:2-haloacid dehalogenase